MIRRLKSSFAIAVAVAALVGSTPALAFEGLKGIIGVDIGDSGQLIIRFDSNTSCGTPVAFVNRTELYYNDMYAMVLTAQANGKPINPYVGACDVQGKAQIVRLITGFVW